MENPDAYRAGKELVKFEWRQSHRNFYSSFSLKFYQEDDMPLLTGWFPSQSGGDEVRKSGTDAFSNPVPWQLTWVQWFELQNVLAELDLPAYRKPDSGSYDEVDSEIRVVWRTDDGDETQKLSGSHAEALETLVLGIAEEAYAASKLETAQREVSESAKLTRFYWNQSALSVIDSFSFSLRGTTQPFNQAKEIYFSYRYSTERNGLISRVDVSVPEEQAQAFFDRLGKELRAQALPMYHVPGAHVHDATDSHIAATWSDDGQSFTNSYNGEGAQSIYTLLVEFAEKAEVWFKARPVPEGGWRCETCGNANSNNVFCAECGCPRPAENKENN